MSAISCAIAGISARRAILRFGVGCNQHRVPVALAESVLQTATDNGIRLRTSMIRHWQSMQA